LFLVIADQVTKLVVKGFSIPFLGLEMTGMEYGSSFDVLGDFLKITFIENPGMAFGLYFGETSKFFLSLFSIAASFGLLYYLYRIRETKFINRLSVALIIAGAVGNLIDRVFYGVLFGYERLMYGRVVDFINVDFFNIEIFGYNLDRWPIFNIADASVSIGVVLLIFFTSAHKTVDEQDNGTEISEVKTKSENLTANILPEESV